MASEINLGALLDAGQITRIEATHRGFLYQHVFGAACLLHMWESKASLLIIEKDEDIEIVWTDRRSYIQVKTRLRPLQWNDIEDAIARFDILRSEHAKQLRSGVPKFVIVSNQVPGPELSRKLKEKEWPSDVFIQWPTADQSLRDIPPAWTSIMDGIAWSVEIAKKIPLLATAPETLVWKLASRIHLAATGYDDHKFSLKELPNLFDQLIIQLQNFPAAPQNYRSQIDEPSLQSTDRIRLVSGVSGSGKTCWVSQSVLHCTELAVYFDVNELPQSSLANSLAREIVAKFFADSKTGIVATIMAANSGLDMLRIIDQHFKEKNIPVNVVLDNIHSVNIDIIKSIVNAAQNVRFVLLAQPWKDKSILEATLSIKGLELKGWSIDAIASEFSDQGCAVEIDTAQRLLNITQGLPLFVQSSVRIATKQYKGEAKAFCSDLENRNHAEETIQDIILSKTFQNLSEPSANLAAILSLSDVTLNKGEVEKYASVVVNGKTQIATSLRELNLLGIITISLGGEIKLHDIFRGLSKDHLNELGVLIIEKSHQLLRDILFDSMPGGLRRFSLYIRLLAHTGQIRTLVDLATFEWFHEKADPRELKIVLEEACESEGLSDEDKFWALDALAFWDAQDHLYESIPKRVRAMELLTNTGKLGSKELVALSMKKIIAGGFNGDRQAIENGFKDGIRNARDDRNLMRLIKYNRAYAYYHIGEYEIAKDETEELYVEYYEHLGLDPLQIVAKNPNQILPLVESIATWQDDLKHLADCLDLNCGAFLGLGLTPILQRIHAMKFYAMTGAYNSAIRAGQNVVDEFIGRGDAEGARSIIEKNILPIVQHYQLINYSLQVRSQYAVVLAYCGKFDEARQEMKLLRVYQADENQKLELDNQDRYIEEIASQQRRIKEKMPKGNTLASTAVEKIGRNDLCPCGSGLKYKRCHGQ